MKKDAIVSKDFYNIRANVTTGLTMKATHNIRTPDRIVTISRKRPADMVKIATN